MVQLERVGDLCSAGDLGSIPGLGRPPGEGHGIPLNFLCLDNPIDFPMFKLILEKAEESEIKLPTSDGSSKEQESSRKISISALLNMPNPSTVWITINCGKF